MDGAGGVWTAIRPTMMAASPIAPPVVELGRLAQWRPLPLSVRDARRAAPTCGSPCPTRCRPKPRCGPEVLVARHVGVSHRGVQAVHEVSMRLGAGERVVLMGRNGSGKSSLLWALSRSRPAGRR